jgi:hypothetical protein
MDAHLSHADDVGAGRPAPNGGFREAGRRLLGPVAIAVVLLVVFWWWLTLAVQGSPADWAFDFRQFWQGANDAVEGRSPYPSEALLATSGDHLDPEGIRDVFRFPYPAGALVVLAPFGLLSFHAAAAVWSALLIASVLAALALLGVRDWRVLAVVVASAPLISSVRLGTLTPVLVLLLAAAWRWRDRPWVGGSTIALAVSLKLFVWPAVVWLLATRRYAAAIVAAALAAALTIGAWAALGFDGLAEYPELLRRLTDVVADRGYSLVALGTELGLLSGVAEALPWLVGLALLVAVVRFGRRADGDAMAFSLAIVAALALTPIVWMHYFALLLVPLAVTSPRFTWAWLLLLGFWVLPGQENDGELLWIVVAAVLTCAVAAHVALRQQRGLAR